MKMAEFIDRAISLPVGSSIQSPTGRYLVFRYPKEWFVLDVHDQEKQKNVIGFETNNPEFLKEIFAGIFDNVVAVKAETNL